MYNERFYVGYRWFDHKKIEPMFPFGQGLSYTAFKYKTPAVSKGEDKTGRNARWTVSVQVTNAGKVPGREIVQLYASYPRSSVERCVRELKGFAKTKLLKPGESETVKIPLTARDLAYFDDFSHRFTTPAGTYELSVGSSSRDLRGKVTVATDKTVQFAD